MGLFLPLGSWSTETRVSEQARMEEVVHCLINRGEPGITIWGTWGTRMGTVSVFYYPVEGYWHLEGEDQAHQSILNM